MKKTLIGIVASDKMDKTRRVEVKRLFPHTRYGKIVGRRTVCHVHDENNESKVGDRVEIIESRPLSRLKRWQLVRIVEVATDPMAANIDDPIRAENVPSEEETVEVTGEAGEATAESEES